MTRAVGPSGSRSPSGLANSPPSRQWRRRSGWRSSPIDVRDAGEIERAVAHSRVRSGGGLIVPAGPLAILHRDLIVTLAARHRLPAVYPSRYYVTDGGLISYGPRFDRSIPARGRLRRSHPQGREAGRPSGAGADQIELGSISRLPRRSASTCRRRCSPAPTR